MWGCGHKSETVLEMILVFVSVGSINNLFLTSAMTIAAIFYVCHVSFPCRMVLGFGNGSLHVR